MTTKNEAAAHLRSLLRFLHPDEEASAKRELDAALNTERLNTVERTGLRITGDQIRAALDELGPTGDKAEAYVKAAALGMATLLDEVSRG